MSAISYNFGISALSRLILGGISLVIVSFLTRYLGPDGFGHYSLIFAYLYIFTTLADLGLYTILVREISKEGVNEKSVASNIFTLRLTSLVIFLALGTLLIVFTPYPGEIKIGMMVAMFFAVFSSMSQVLTGIFQKYLRLYLVSISDVVARLCQLGLVLFSIRLRPGLLTFVWIVVVSELIHFLFIFLFSRRLIKVSLEFDFKYWSKIIKNALPIAVSLVFVLLYFKMDTVLLSLMKPAYDVGVYSVAYKILEVLIFFPAIYVGLIMPIMSRHAFASKNEFTKTFHDSFDILAIFALPTMAFLIFRAGDVINIIGGSQFAESANVLKILSIAIMLIFFGNLAGSALVALDLQKRGLKIYFLGAAFNVIANLILIPRYSFYATAWTTVLTEVFITVGILWLIKKRTDVSARLSVFFKSVFATVITVLAIYPLHLNFFFAMPAYLIYFPILYLLKGYTLDNFKELIKFKTDTGSVSGL